MSYMFINIKNNEYENILGTCVQWIQKSFLQQTHQKIFARWNLFIIKNLILQSKHSKFVSYLERWVTGLLENSSLAQGNMDNIWQWLIFKMLTERIWVFFSISPWSVSVAHVPVAWMFYRYPVLFINVDQSKVT